MKFSMTLHFNVLFPQFNFQNIVSRCDGLLCLFYSFLTKNNVFIVLDRILGVLFFNMCWSAHYFLLT